MKKRTTISLDEEKMEKLDSIAALTGRTKSGLISLLIGWIRPGRKSGDIEIDRNGNEDQS